METLKLLAALGWRNLWRNKRRTLITFTAIGVGVWSMITLASLMDAWSMSTFNASVNTMLGHGQLHAEKYLDDPSVEHRFEASDQIRSLMESNTVKAWAPRIRVSAIVQSERESTPVTLIGINPVQENGLSFIPDAIKQGRYLSDINDSGIVLGQKLVTRLRTGLNKRIVLMSQDQNGFIAERGFRIVGIFEADQKETESMYAFISITQSQKLLGVGNAISEISFVVHDLEALTNYISTLQKNFTQLDIASWSKLEPFTSAVMDISSGTIAIWTITMFTLVAFGLVNTLLMAVFERTREFGLVQALGMRPRFILFLILIESIFLIGIAVVVGLITGTATILFFDNGIDMGALAEGATTFGAGRVIYPEIDWLQCFYISLFVWFMGTIVSLYPAWHASREVPVKMINKSY